MSAMHLHLPNVGSIIIVIAVLATMCIVYWRSALRIAAIVFMTLVIYGAVEIAKGIHP